MVKAHRQSGLTLIGFLLLLSVIGFTVFIGMRLFPVYQEYYAVTTAMKQLQQEPGIAQRNTKQIEDLLFR